VILIIISLNILEQGTIRIFPRGHTEAEIIFASYMIK
jgi:hypothetical protein